MNPHQNCGHSYAAWWREEAERLSARVTELEQERDAVLAQVPTGPPSDPGGRLVLNAYGRAAWNEGYERANERIAALGQEVARLKALIAAECTCRVIEKCERCEAIENAEDRMKGLEK